MKLFKHVVIETNSFCTRKCIFCPKYKDERKEIVELPMETIHKIVNELKEYGFNKVDGARIELALYNEPTFDKRLPEIIKYIRDNLPRVHIFFNSNGDVLRTPEQYIKLFECGITGLELNIYEEKDRERLTNIYNDVRKQYGENKFNEPPESQNELNYVTTSLCKGKVSFLLIDKVNFGSLKSIHKIRNKAGHLDWLVPNIKEPIKMVCGFPFRYFVVRSDGFVNLCCDDYYNDFKYENMNNPNVTIKSIWEGEKITEIRKRLLKRDRNFYPCDVCDNVITFRPHLIYKDWNYLVPTEELQDFKEKPTIKYINPLKNKEYPDVMNAVMIVLTEAKGKIELNEAAKKLLEIQIIAAKDPIKRAKSVFISAAKTKSDGSFLYGVPTKVTKISNKTYVELITDNNKYERKSLFE